MPYGCADTVRTGITPSNHNYMLAFSGNKIVHLITLNPVAVSLQEL